MSPVTHFLVGWLTANTCKLEKRDRALVTIAGVIPDADGLGIVPELLTRNSAHPLNWWSEYHHVLGHNLGFCLLVTVAMACFARQPGRTAILVAISFHLHLFCDLIGARGPDGDSWPIPYLSPFSTAWQWSWSGQWALNAWPNMLITGLAIFISLRLAWQRGYSPVEMFSAKAEGAVIQTLQSRFPKRSLCTAYKPPCEAFLRVLDASLPSAAMTRRTIAAAALGVMLSAIPLGAAETPVVPKPDPNREVRGTGGADDPSRQTENDWVDDRWTKTDIGQFLCATIDTPGLRAFKGIAIKVGEHDEGTVCFDTDLMRMNAGWTGGFLKLDPKRYGLIVSPKMDGTLQFSGAAGPGWGKDFIFGDPRTKTYGPLPKDFAHFTGLYRSGKRTVLRYTVGGVEVMESPWATKDGDTVVFTRTFEISPSDKQMQLKILQAPGGTKETLAYVYNQNGTPFESATLTGDNETTRVHFYGGASPVQFPPNKNQLIAIVPPHTNIARITVAIWKESTKKPRPVDATLRLNETPSLNELIKGGPSQWNPPLITKGSRGFGGGPLEIDTLTVPYENPWKALFFTSGVDFFKNGDAALCTAHGDVWRISGIDDKLDKLTWHRYATGLFQPLGLKIVDDVVYVLGRDQITRLHDLNGDNEADCYENFNNDIEVSGGGHSYATSLETDPEGNFWFNKCAEDTKHGGTTLRVSKDGSKLEVIATGFRNPNGMGMGPDGLVTVADQQGNWVPETRIDVIRPGGFYGFMPMHKRDIAPTDFDRPLLFVPRPLDNSAGGEAWIPPGSWGALGGQMIHLSYGRCTMMTVIRDLTNEGAQGGVTALPGKFLSGVMRAKFNPRDQALYVTGLKGWQTSALRDGCLQRVRYTGAPLRIPTDFAIHANGIRLTFSVPVSGEVAKDIESYGIEQWNFRWSEKYGSPDFKPSQPGVEGRDTIKVKSARVLPDGKSVFIETEPLGPVMQFAVQYNLEDKEGKPLRGAFYTTINRLATAIK